MPLERQKGGENDIERFDEIASQVEDLVQTHGLPCPSRKMLQPRHIKFEFDDNSSIFHKFARAVCRANKVPRKELFEAWAMALYVHQMFPQRRLHDGTANITRFADLACGHGLVSWALLVLYDQENGELSEEEKLPDISAVCIDISMPLAADRIRTEMLEEWPHLEDRWDYVEASVDGIIPSPSTLLVGVHACGQLSDTVIANAIYGNSPLVLIPCCHTKRSLDREQRSNFGLPDQMMDLSSYIDQCRIDNLRNEASYKVLDTRISESITPKNRILLATPPPRPDFEPPTTRLNPSMIQTKIDIPLVDTPEAKAAVRSLAGREAAKSRKLPQWPSFGLVLLLPVSENDNDQHPPANDISIERVLAIARHATGHDDIQVTCPSIKKGDKTTPQPYFHQPTKRWTRTFRVAYNGIEKKQDAKELHIQLCQWIVKEVPGCEVRQVPKADPPQWEVEVCFYRDTSSFILEDGVKNVSLDGDDEDEKKTPEEPSSRSTNSVPTMDDISSELLKQKVFDPEGIEVDIRQINRYAYKRPNGQFMRSFRIRYLNLQKEQAKGFHFQQLSQRLPLCMPGATVSDRIHHPRNISK